MMRCGSGKYTETWKWKVMVVGGDVGKRKLESRCRAMNTEALDIMDSIYVRIRNIEETKENGYKSREDTG